MVILKEARLSVVAMVNAIAVTVFATDNEYDVVVFTNDGLNVPCETESVRRLEIVASPVNNC